MKLSFCIAAAFGASLLTTQSLATTLSFEGEICSGTADGFGPLAVCENLSAINQLYGDSNEVDVVYESDAGSGSSMRFYPIDYSGLQSVAIGGDSPTITLLALGGSTLQLLGFQLGAWPNADRLTQVTVIDLATMLPILNTGSFTVLGATPTVFEFSGVFSNAGFRVNFGPDGVNVGIDQLRFQATPVPEPATYAYMLSGIAMLLALSRSRRAKAATGSPRSARMDA